MMWTRDAVLAFAGLVERECEKSGITIVHAELERKARVIESRALRLLKRGEPYIVLDGDVDRFYVAEGVY